MLNLTPFLRFWRDLNIALVGQGEPEADHREARQAFAIRLNVEGIDPDALA